MLQTGSDCKASILPAPAVKLADSFYNQRIIIGTVQQPVVAEGNKNESADQDQNKDNGKLDVVKLEESQEVFEGNCREFYRIKYNIQIPAIAVESEGQE